MNYGSDQAASGSFRDRDGRVYLRDGRVFRGLSQAAMANYHALTAKPFYKKHLDSGAIIATRELPSGDNPLPASICGLWAGFLEHDPVPVISYPYEWTFSMLKEAALLQLRLTLEAVKAGFTVKDATPYNVQFISQRPVFIDIPSFEPLPDGEPWSGYRQFCEMYLFPLMLQAYKGIHFQPFLRAAIDGVPVQTAARLFGFRNRFRPGVWGHVWLQAKLDRRYSGSSENVRSSLKSAGFNRELILVNLRKLIRLVGRLEWQGNASEWGDYTKFHNYTEADHQSKEQFVDQCVRQAQPLTVWDIGCNTGQFSRIAAANCRQVVATDIDHLAVEQLFVNPDTPGNVMPLVQNVADPSPNWGWRHLERRDLQQRAAPDLVLCLALVHHVVITANIPLAEFVAWLAEVTDQLVIEFVSRDDDKVQTLLRNKQDKYWDYDQDFLEQQLARYFIIRERLDLRAGLRTLYWCSKAEPGGASSSRD